jgi:TRAP-type C4-dicarboxylate transport system permease large subunit
LFGAVILGLGIGLFTPTPAAGVGVCLILLYGLLLRALGRGGIGRLEIGRAVLDTAVTSSMIYLILFAAEVLKGFFARTGLPSAIALWAAQSGLDPWLVLAAMLLLLIVLGCFLESLSMIVVVLPFFWPILVELNGGEDVLASAAAFGLANEELKIWFGILALVVVELGLVTPPVGLNLFIIGSLAPNVPMRETVRGVSPFLAAEAVRILLLLAFPLLTLGLPRLLGH